MKLGWGLVFNDLYEREGLLRVDRAFLGFLGETDGALRDKLASSRADPPLGKAESDLLVALAPHFEDFVARLFGIESEAQALAAPVRAAPRPAQGEARGREARRIFVCF